MRRIGSIVTLAPLLVVLFVACRGDAPAASSDSTTRALVDARIYDGVRARPPYLDYRLDLSLRNPSSEPRWLLWPQVLSQGEHAQRVASGQVINLQPIEISLVPRVVVVSGFGANFWAVRLPGHGQLTLAAGLVRVAVDTPALPPESLELEVIVATAIMADGEPIETHLGARLTCAQEATARGPTSPFGESAEPEKVWRPADGMGTVTVAVESRDAIELRPPPVD
jgi:hypothetical protein